MQFQVGGGNPFEPFENFRLQRLLHRRQRKRGFFLVVLVIIIVVAIVVVVIFVIVAIRGGRQTRAIDGSDDAFAVRAAAIGRVKIDDVAQQHLSFHQRIMPMGDRLHGQRAFAQRADHFFAARLDPLCDGDFAFPRQQLHIAHFAQVHPDGIVSPADFIILEIAGNAPGIFRRLGRLVAGIFGFFPVDDIDAHFGEHRHGVFDLLGRHLVLRQNRVQLINGDIATLLGLRQELLHFLAQPVHQGSVRRFFRGLRCLNLRCRRFRCHPVLSPPHAACLSQGLAGQTRRCRPIHLYRQAVDRFQLHRASPQILSPHLPPMRILQQSGPAPRLRF